MPRLPASRPDMHRIFPSTARVRHRRPSGRSIACNSPCMLARIPAFIHVAKRAAQLCTGYVVGKRGAAKSSPAQTMGKNPRAKRAPDGEKSAAPPRGRRGARKRRKDLPVAKLLGSGWHGGGQITALPCKANSFLAYCSESRMPLSLCNLRPSALATDWATAKDIFGGTAFPIWR